DLSTSQTSSRGEACIGSAHPNFPSTSAFSRTFSALRIPSANARLISFHTAACRSDIIAISLPGPITDFEGSRAFWSCSTSDRSMNLHILNNLERPILPQPISSSSPLNRVTEKSGNPETEAEYILQRKQGPIDAGREHAAGDSPGREASAHQRDQ